MGWKLYAARSRIEREHVLGVGEEAMLHELPWREIDDPGSRREVCWPAEGPLACAAILLTWLRPG
jgi:hypothetical protein